MRILLVEDNPTTQIATEELLKQSGYEVDHAANGSMALTRMAVNPVDVVIADYLMPVMDGSRLAMCIRENPNWSKVLIVFTTAVAGSEWNKLKDKLRGMEPIAFLHKPFDIEELLGIIRNHGWEVVTSTSKLGNFSIGTSTSTKTTTNKRQG